MTATITAEQGSAMQDNSILAGVALARLEGSYGMTELGAGRLLADARQRDDGTASTLAATVTLASRYPEAFTVTSR